MTRADPVICIVSIYIEMSLANFFPSIQRADHFHHFTQRLIIRVSYLTVFVSVLDDKTQVYNFTIILYEHLMQCDESMKNLLNPRITRYDFININKVQKLRVDL